MEQLNPNETIVTAAGEPFKTEAAAQGTMALKKLDRNFWEIRPFGDGFAIVKKVGHVGQTQTSEVSSLHTNSVFTSIEQAPPGLPPMRYFEVIFLAASSPNEPEDVQLSVNGEVLICKRQKKTMLPESYLECADHATYDKFEQVPFKPRKMVARIRKFPYQVIREVSKEEFAAFREAGNKITKDNIRKFGWDYVGDDEPDFLRL